MGSNENEDDLDDVFSAEKAARGVVSDDDDDIGFVFVPISTNNTSTTSRFDEWRVCVVRCVFSFFSCCCLLKKLAFWNLNFLSFSNWLSIEKRDKKRKQEKKSSSSSHLLRCCSRERKRECRERESVCVEREREGVLWSYPSVNREGERERKEYVFWVGKNAINRFVVVVVCVCNRV